MSASPWDFILDALAADIFDDFGERNIAAQVLVGEWETFKHLAGPRVVLGLGDFAGTIGQPLSSRYMPGLAIDTGNGTEARTLGASLQDVIFWVAAQAPKGTPAAQVHRTARRATWSLTAATLAATWRSNGGAFPWGRGQWIHEESAISTLGAAVRFVATFPVPILDDPDELITVTRATGAETVDVGGTSIGVPPPVDTAAP